MKTPYQVCCLFLQDGAEYFEVFVKLWGGGKEYRQTLKDFKGI